MPGKGITPVVAVIMLLLIVISIVGGVYVWTQRTMAGVQNQTAGQIQHKIGQIATRFRIDGVSGNKIYVRNLGANSLDTTKLGVYVDGERVSFQDAGKIGSGKIGTLLVTDQMVATDKKMNVKVTSALKEDEKVKNYIFYSNFEKHKSPAVDNFNLINGWSVDQTPHCNHCGCPCNDWCGDCGAINSTDYEDGGTDCKGKGSQGAAYLRHSSTLTTDSMNLTGLSSATLSFWWRGRSFDGDTEKATVEVWDGSSWQEVICMEDESGGDDAGCERFDDVTWYKENIDITPYLNSDFKVRFTGSPGSWDDLWIDKIKVK